MRTWVVDAFTDVPFGGNPAAVVLLESPADEAWMKRVAAEMRHSETAFVQRRDDGWSLRWFTPTREVDLCGHATLATAHVLWSEALADGPLHFHTRSGELVCTRSEGQIAMQFPSAPATPLAPDAVPVGLFEALGIAPVAVWGAGNGNLLLELASESALAAVAPDFRALEQLSNRHGYILTAPARDDATDVVVRYFVPAWGIDEDPATGSIQCTLAPYWLPKLGQAFLRTRQIGPRPARLESRIEGERTVVQGRAVTVLSGALV